MAAPPPLLPEARVVNTLLRHADNVGRALGNHEKAAHEHVRLFVQRNERPLTQSKRLSAESAGLAKHMLETTLPQCAAGGEQLGAAIAALKEATAAAHLCHETAEAQKNARAELHGERVKQLEALQSSLEQHENTERERFAEEARLQLQGFARQLSGPQVVTPVVSGKASPTPSREAAVSAPPIPAEREALAEAKAMGEEAQAAEAQAAEADEAS